MKRDSLILFAVFRKCIFPKLKSSNPLKVFKCTFALLGILCFKDKTVLITAVLYKDFSIMYKCHISVTEVKSQEEEYFNDFLLPIMKNTEK